MTVRLLPMTLAHLDAEDISGAALADRLGVPAPPQWPPLHNDANTRAWMRQTRLTEGWDDHWAGGYIVAGEDGVEKLVGIAGYFGPPGDDGEVEIGYSVIAPEQRRGYASAAVSLLVDAAFAMPGVVAVRATTLADGVASQGVLTRCGFSKVGEDTDPDEGPVWRFAIQRPA